MESRTFEAMTRRIEGRFRGRLSAFSTLRFDATKHGTVLAESPLTALGAIVMMGPTKISMEV